METLVLTAADVNALLPMPQCISAVESAFRALGQGDADPPITAAVHGATGSFHIKAGVLHHAGRRFFAAKSNGNFPGNPARSLPTIQGLLILADAEDGRVLAVMDSIALTALRTAAATAVAARHLARADCDTLAVVGCGAQARAHVRALQIALPLRRVVVCDVDAAAAARFASELASETLELVVVDNVTDALALADACVTCTTSSQFLLWPEQVRRGTFVAGVGVDNEQKRELAPGLMAAAKVVTDLRSQCAQIGDLHHAFEAGAMTLADVHADLSEVLAGRRAGRENDDEIIIFDSTGIALQDVAAAIVVYESAAGHATGSAIKRVSFA